MKYRVLAPVAFMDGDKGVTCTTGGALVEVDDEQAKELVDAGKLEVVKDPKPAAKAKES